jgi:hypothetical protein
MTRKASDLSAGSSAGNITDESSTTAEVEAETDIKKEITINSQHTKLEFIMGEAQLARTG